MYHFSYFNVSAWIRYRDRSGGIYYIGVGGVVTCRGWMGPCPTSKMKSSQDVDGWGETRDESVYFWPIVHSYYFSHPSEPVHCPTPK